MSPSDLGDSHSAGSDGCEDDVLWKKEKWDTRRPVRVRIEAGSTSAA